MPQKYEEKEEIIQALVHTGFDENDAMVYRALLKLGQVGAAAIVRETGLHGQIVYRVLERLQKRGLVSRTLFNNRGRFNAHAPSQLLEQHDRQREALAETVAVLEHIHTPPLEDGIRVFQGREQFIAEEFELIRGMPTNSTLYVITGTSDMYTQILGNQLIAYDHVKVKKNITTRLICPDDQKRIYTITDRPLISFRALPQRFSGDINIGIYGDIFGMYFFTEPVSSIIIHNKVVAQSYKNFFEALWNMGK